MDKERVKQVRDELKAVGVGSVGLHTPESKDLTGILHADEHIGGAVYGRYDNGLAWLVATDQRIIFMDHKPLFKTTDEVTYEVVSGFKSTRAGLSTSVVLHTRVGDYSLRFVVPKCARIFGLYVENRRLDTNSSGQLSTPAALETPLVDVQVTGDHAMDFLREHDLGVLSTVDRTGNVHGAVVYYHIDQSNSVYILTKSGTDKGRNVYAHNQVALTIHEVGTMKTLQLQGIAQVETDQKAKDEVFTQIVKPRFYRDGTSMPPVTKLHEGAFMVIKITPTLINFHDYSKVE